MPAEDGQVIQKCELCIKNAEGSPACVKGCPNKAIVFEDNETRENEMKKSEAVK